MHNRIKEIRKSQRFTQKQLGELLGVSRDAIANIENGRVEPSPLFIKGFCSEFNINKEWLLTGEGEPYLNGLSGQDELLADIFACITLDDNHKLRNIIEKISKLDDEYLDVIEKLVEGLIR